MNKTVFKNKNECCGCSACANICPKKAITIEKDEYGFTYPLIDETKCINCKLCEKVCLYKNKCELNKPIYCYAGQANDEKVCEGSTSGGIFYTIANECLNKDFIVYGAYMFFENSKSIIKHIRIDNKKELYKLQGSKYVQSDIFDIFEKIRNDLGNNKKVLLSGTPCQIQAVKNYLYIKKTDDRFLFTIDIICHGVPSQSFFNNYIDSVRKEYEVVDFKFRDKTEGWGLMGSITFKKNDKYRKQKHYPKLSPYYYLFLNADTYRDSCYNCKFSCKNRVGDITLGDYWGIEKLHPDFLKINGGKLDENRGISCILINSEKGKKLYHICNSMITKENSNIENISKYNHNLNEPSKKGDNREFVLKQYKNSQQFNTINKWYKKKLGIKYYLYSLWIILPNKVRRVIRKILKK